MDNLQLGFRGGCFCVYGIHIAFQLLSATLSTGKKNASFQGWRFLEIVVHLIPAHYPFAARGIEK
jgi:hypothetical protein